MSLAPADADALEALLLFYRDSGVHGVIDDAPADWFARSAPAPARSAPARPAEAATRMAAAAPLAPAQAQRLPPADAAMASARDIAAAAQSLDALRAAMEAFDGCALKATASRLVFEDGARDAPLMLVGEAPGREEDIEGKPFVGRSGQLLDRMLAAIGLDRTQVYIANIVPWRPPGNRTPTPQEAAICRPFILRQIELCAPKIVVTIGAPSAQALLEIKEGIMKARGRWSEATFGSHTAAAMATLHPAYLLRTPSAKRASWLDMLAIRERLDALKQ